MARVLVVDDDASMLAAHSAVAGSSGHETIDARSGNEALSLIEGVIEGVVMSTSATRPSDNPPRRSRVQAVEARAMKAEGNHGVTRPVDIENLSLVVERPLEARSLRLENKGLTADKLLGRSIIADSPPMRRLLQQVERIGPGDLTVLVRGETGTGKELITSLLHARSRRAAGPLIRFNCAAVPVELAESELFGHVRGAFTGAHQSRPGFFTQAHGGTLVLDEIGELHLHLQAVLLRALQDGEIQPVGAGKVERANVRIIACTNHDLGADAREGRFRQDLYYRLAVVDLVIPPLRERREDIPSLAREFARIYGERFGKPEFQLSAEDVGEMVSAEWPGNVRQLENAVARMVALGERPQRSPDDRPEAAPQLAEALTLREQVEALERELIGRTLATLGGNQSGAARRLGLSRGALIDRMRKYGLLRGSPGSE
ncbi:MAG TPA: sigma-54 dependent transcriptional regulator [Myxococcaceae bacterium]|nr:sigma-54 dependent transcriptional regulator [Myxococcaceae bacterium]